MRLSAGAPVPRPMQTQTKTNNSSLIRIFHTQGLKHLKKLPGDSENALWVKAIATKPDNLSPLSRVGKSDAGHVSYS